MRRVLMAVMAALVLWGGPAVVPASAQAPVLLRDAAVGGATVATNEWRLSGTIGDGVVSGPVTAGSYRLRAGFLVLTTTQKVYLPTLQR